MSQTAKRLTTLLRSGGSGIYIPSQSLGAELLTNGDFSNGLNSWTKLNDNGTTATITETAANGSAGTGSASYANSGSAVSLGLTQSVFSVGDYYEVGAELTAYTSGRLDVTMSSNAFFNLTSAKAARYIGRASGTNLQPQVGGALPRTLTLDNLSVKKLTLSPEKTAPSEDMDVSFLYTLPASPLSGDSVWLPARISSFSSGNYWLVYLEYSGTQWNVYLYSVASHTRTQQKTASNVGTTNGLRFYALGTTIRMYTTANSGTNWTQRDTDLTSSTYQSSVGYNAIYGSQFTPGALAYTAAT